MVCFKVSSSRLLYIRVAISYDSVTSIAHVLMKVPSEEGKEDGKDPPYAIPCGARHISLDTVWEYENPSRITPQLLSISLSSHSPTQ